MVKGISSINLEAAGPRFKGKNQRKLNFASKSAPD